MQKPIDMVKRPGKLVPLLLALGLVAGCHMLAEPPLEPHISLAKQTVAAAFDEARTTASKEAQRLGARNAQSQRLATASRLMRFAVLAGDKAAKATPPPPPGEVLLLGDSMAWALGVELKPLLEEAGHPFHFRYKVSDSVRSWRTTKAAPLKEALRKHPEADVVIIVMGSNDFMYPRSERLKATLELVNQLVENRSCFWVGPPMWRKDNGIVAFLADASAPCHFFNSSKLTLKRRSDGIHPNREGARTWATAVHDWLQQTGPLTRRGPHP